MFIYVDEKIDHRELKVDPRKFGHENRLKSAVFSKSKRGEISAPVGIRTRVAGSKGQNDWPDYTTGAKNIFLIEQP